MNLADLLLAGLGLIAFGCSAFAYVEISRERRAAHARALPSPPERRRTVVVVETHGVH